MYVWLCFCRWIHDYQDACVDKLLDFMEDTRATIESTHNIPSPQNLGIKPTLRKTGSIDSHAPNRSNSHALYKLGKSVDSLT